MTQPIPIEVTHLVIMVAIIAGLACSCLILTGIIIERSTLLSRERGNHKETEAQLNVAKEKIGLFAKYIESMKETHLKQYVPRRFKVTLRYETEQPPAFDANGVIEKGSMLLFFDENFAAVAGWPIEMVTGFVAEKVSDPKPLEFWVRVIKARIEKLKESKSSHAPYLAAELTALLEATGYLERKEPDLAAGDPVETP